jgi:hypothetical protein
MIRSICAAFVVGGAALGGVATFAVAHAAPKSPATPVQEQVKQLLRRVEQLEARVAELEQRVPGSIIPPEGAPELRVMPEGSSGAGPKGWIPREFNGMRYYDIPLNKTSQPQ